MRHVNGFGLQMI